ncbi:prenyltransferase/squalene oxidase repeat-containing protein [Halorubrum ezzemoulense]|nr:prenyltransferase/squalene oxidase repeat-containing protein [Halorubrum ezzemoulense]
MTSVKTILKETLEYSSRRNYVGWDKHDGMSSRIRRKLPFKHKLTNLAFQETIKRAPVNLRPILLIEQQPNPKGLSLFTMANLNAYIEFSSERYLSEAQTLCERILSHDVDGVDGFCLSHQHTLQDLSDTKSPGTPNIVSTSYGVKALLQASNIDDKYAVVAHRSADFVKSELLTTDQDQYRISYTPTKEDSYTLNANALAARLFIDLYDQFCEDEYRVIAEGILNYVKDQQEEVGGWKYTDPPSASHLGMDNYHNGFIIESFLRYQEVTNENIFKETIQDGVNFYRNVLYNKDGSPCWDESSTYPHDIHAAAQGIVTFTHAGDIEFARTIIDWTIKNLYAGDGQFYYQTSKFYTKKYTLMRWCQAWMAYALSTFLRYRDRSNI